MLIDKFNQYLNSLGLIINNDYKIIIASDDYENLLIYNKNKFNCYYKFDFNNEKCYIIFYSYDIRFNKLYDIYKENNKVNDK